MDYQYKIQRESDGLFSMGGLCPRFSRKGKTWNDYSSLMLHLRLLQMAKKPNLSLYRDCYVVTYEVTQRPAISVTEALKEYHRQQEQDDQVKPKRKPKKDDRDPMEKKFFKCVKVDKWDGSIVLKNILVDDDTQQKVRDVMSQYVMQIGGDELFLEMQTVAISVIRAGVFEFKQGVDDYISAHTFMSDSDYIEGERMINTMLGMEKGKVTRRRGKNS